MTKRRRWSLRFGLSSAFVAMVLVTAAVLCGFLFQRMHEQMRKDIRDRIRDVATIGSLGIDPELHRQVLSRADEANEPYKVLKAHLQRVKAQVPELRFAYTLKRSGDRSLFFWVDAETDPEIGSRVGDPVTETTETMHAAFDDPRTSHVEPSFYSDKWGTWLTGYAPVFGRDGKLECVFAVDISAARIAEQELSALLVLLAWTGLFTLAVAALGVLLSRRIIQPLGELEAAMYRVRDLDLTHSEGPDSRFLEIIRMRDTLNTMKSGLRSFSHYVPTQLVRELIRRGEEATLGGRRVELTIFFSDIEGFTTIAESTTPEGLAEDLADYFALITSTIVESGGTVDKYIGDAVMAFWGAPIPMEDHAQRGLRTALLIRRRLQELNTRREAAGRRPLNTRIGLTTGEVVVGNFGYAERFDYTVMGDTVNLASRLEGLNKYVGTGILASEACIRRGAGLVLARMAGVVAVKGKSEPVRILEPLALAAEAGDELRAQVEAWNEAFARYAARDFAGALPVFEAWAARNPADDAAQRMVELCREYLENPPPEGWQATVVMTSK